MLIRELVFFNQEKRPDKSQEYTEDKEGGSDDGS